MAVASVPIAAGQALGPDLGQIHADALSETKWDDELGNENVGITGNGIVVMLGEGYDALSPEFGKCPDLAHHAIIVREGAFGTWQSIPSPRNEYGGHGNVVASTMCSSSLTTHVGVAPGITLFSADAALTDGLLPSPSQGEKLESWYDRIRIQSHSATHDPISYYVQIFGMPSEANILIPSAVGNSGGDGLSTMTVDHLHSDDRILGVGAINADASGVASYSSKGAKVDSSTWPDLVAPGCMFAYHGAPWPDAGINGVAEIAGLAGSSPGDCPTFSPDQVTSALAQGYVMVSGTSLSAPIVAGVAALMLEVNPSLNSTQLKFLLTRTADPFMPTNDLDGDGKISTDEFWLEHGWEAGYGLVNATAAVAAAHYLLLQPEAPLEEAISCFAAPFDSLGTLHLNPNLPVCEAFASRAMPASPGPAVANHETPGPGLAAVFLLISVSVFARPQRD